MRALTTSIAGDVCGTEVWHVIDYEEYYSDYSQVCPCSSRAPWVASWHIRRWVAARWRRRRGRMGSRRVATTHRPLRRRGSPAKTVVRMIVMRLHVQLFRRQIPPGSPKPVSELHIPAINSRHT